MRSTFIHIAGSNQQEVEQALTEFSAEGIYINYYHDHPTEFSWQEGEELRELLGVFPPDVTVMADISGRIIGYEESLSLARFLLGRFAGVVQDDGVGLWSLEDLLRDKPIDGRYFMGDSRVHAGLKIPNGEQDGAGNPLPAE